MISNNMSPRPFSLVSFGRHEKSASLPLHHLILNERHVGLRMGETAGLLMVESGREVPELSLKAFHPWLLSTNSTECWAILGSRKLNVKWSSCQSRRDRER